jgi:hypothetical protein
VLLSLGDSHFGDVRRERLDQLTRRVWIRRLDLIDLDHDGDPYLLGGPWDDDNPNPILWVSDGGRSVRTPQTPASPTCTTTSWTETATTAATSSRPGSAC